MLPRTYIASNGLDANDGKLATPCRTIGAALAQTDPGGEIIVLDSAGYGTAVITKSVSVIAPPGIYAGITVAAGTGIDVTAGVVTLRGLTIRGPGGQIGVHVGNATVHIDSCVIAGLAQFGIHADTANGDVHVRDTQITQCSEGLRFDGSVRFVLQQVRTAGNGNLGLNVQNGARGVARDLLSARNGNHGISVQNAAAGTDAYLALDGATIAANGASGIVVGVPGAVVTRANIAVTRSTIAGNSSDGISVSTQNAGAAIAQISDNVIDANGQRGIAATGNGAIVLVCGNRITRNVAFGVFSTGGGTVKTEGDNMLDSNNMGGPQAGGALTPLAGV